MGNRVFNLHSTSGQTSELSPQQFDLLCKRVHLTTGCLLEKNDEVRAKLSRKMDFVLKECQIGSFDELLKRLQLADPFLMESFLSAFFAGRPRSFYKEKFHFDFFQNIFKNFVADPKNSKEIFRVWSASAAGGEESYTLSILAHELLGGKTRSRFKVHGTDLDIRCLRKAAGGVFTKEELSALPLPLVSKYFNEKIDGNLYLHKEILGTVSFSQFNLMNFDYQSKHKFQAIFCRENISTFEKATTHHVVNMLVNNTEENGFIYFSEREAPQVSHEALKSMGKGIFQKKTLSTK